MQPNSTHGHLERKLRNRHIQLIALGGTIGTGLFLGSAGVLELAGPSMLLGYAIGGLVAFLIMRFLGAKCAERGSRRFGSPCHRSRPQVPTGRGG